MGIVRRLIIAFRIVADSAILAAKLLWLCPFAWLAYSRRGGRDRARRPEGSGKASSYEQSSGEVSPSDASGDLFVLYSQVAWQGPWQRPQEMAMGLSERRRVLFVSPIQVHERHCRYPRWKRIEVVSKVQKRGLAPHLLAVPVPGFAGLTVFSPLIFSGEYRSSLIFRLNRLLILSELMWLLRREGRVALCANTPFADFLLGRLRTSMVVYDVMDDFAAFGWAPGGAARMHERMLSAAQVVFTGTYTLRERVKEQRPDAVFVPCGVDFAKFARPANAETSRTDAAREDIEPEDIRGLPRPLIGYVGTLSDRTDTSILAGLAERFPQASLVLIGPVYRSMGEAPRAANIHYLGLKPHDAIPAYLRRFQVAIMPFRLTPGSLAINPVKALEYLAAGCVMVSTRIPDVERFYSDVALIASSPEDFVEKVAAALSGGNEERIRKGIEKARAASWQRMIDEMERLMRDRDSSVRREN